MKNQNIYISAIIILLIGGGLYYYFNLPRESEFSPDPTATPSPGPFPVNINDWKDYENSKRGFTLRLPEDWTWQEDYMGMIVIFWSPSKNSSQDNPDYSRPSFNVTIEDLNRRKDKDSLSLDKYVEEQMNSLKVSLSEFKLLEGSNFEVSGNPGYRIVFSGIRNGEEMKFSMIFSIKSSNAYLLTYTTRPEEFQSFLTHANEMARSFDLTETTDQ